MKRDCPFSSPAYDDALLGAGDGAADDRGGEALVAQGGDEGLRVLLAQR